ncbi:MAG: hypothetical protein RMN52_03295 [Anaerolineae bacterium]|nr:hypothetical protein [Candidatus Roseilinea sp.]MDW8449005.1 hypothetical protein [Anaerolineae bacterium]
MKRARTSTFLALACAAGIVALSTPSYAEPASQPNIRVNMIVDAGFNSYVKENTWVPLRITLVNSGDPIEGEVVVTNTSLATTARFAQPVSLGRNARRQVTLYAPPGSDSLEVQLISGDQVIASVTPVTRQLAPADRLVLIASDPPDAFNFIGDVRAPNGSTSALALLRLDQLPDRVAALNIADAIVLSGVDTNTLTPSQRDAIRQWVVGGGHLILAGGPNAELALGGLAEVAPGRSARILTEADAGALAELAAPVALDPLAPLPSASIPVIRLQPAASHVRTLTGSNETPLILRREVGRGIVDQLAFDPALAPLRDWPGRAALFTALLGGRAGLANDVGAIGDGTAATFAAAALTAASPPPSFVVGGFFALYVLVIGPLNFLILRRLRKLSWAWVTVPAIVIAFTLLGLLTGFRLRGNQAHVHRLSVTLGDAATGDAQSFGIFGLFSPRRVETTFEAGRSLMHLVEPPRNPDEAAPSVTFITGEPSRIIGIAVTNSDVRTVYARDGAKLLPVSASLRFIPGDGNTAATIGGTIRNDTPHRLRNCTIVAGKDYQAIGDIAPGVTTDVKLNLVVGHPYSLPPIRTINASPERLTGGRLFGFSAAGRSSRPSSSGSPANPGGSKYPFEQNTPPLADALVNWQDFSDEPTRQDAQFGLVSTVFGAEGIGPGVYLGCWEWRDETGAQIEGADYTDRALRLWRLPVGQHLVEAGEVLPPDVFTWGVVATDAGVELNDNGLLMEPGEHIIALTPWLDVRTTSVTSRISLNIEFDSASTSLSALRDTSIALFNWQTGDFDEVVNDAAEITTQNTHTGPYLSPGGQIFMKFISPTDSLTLTRLATSVEMPRQ